MDDPWRVLLSGCLAEHGADLTERMIEGARAMVAFAIEARAELAILTDMSAACGSQVISDGCPAALPDEHPWTIERLPQRHRRA